MVKENLLSPVSRGTMNLAVQCSKIQLFNAPLNSDVA